MAEFQKVMSELRRLCEGRKCTNCPIYGKYDVSTEVYCSQWIRDHSEEAERIIMDWAKKNPLITNGMKFREVFGINLDSIEVVCRDGEGKVNHHQDVSAWLDKEYKGKDGQDDH